MPTPDLASRVAEIGPYVEGLTFTEGLEPGARLTDVELDGCTFAGSVLERSRLVGCTFTECTFEGVDLSMAVLTDSRFAGCTFRGCKMLAVDWTPLSGRLVLDANVFEDGRLDDSTFTGVDLSRWEFRRCRMRDVDLTEATARHTVFDSCDLSGARFARADLREASLVGSVGWQVDPRDTRVQGLVVDASSAEGLLAPLGVVIR